MLSISSTSVAPIENSSCSWNRANGEKFSAGAGAPAHGPDKERPPNNDGAVPPAKSKKVRFAKNPSVCYIKKPSGNEKKRRWLNASDFARIQNANAAVMHCMEKGLKCQEPGRGLERQTTHGMMSYCEVRRDSLLAVLELQRRNKPVSRAYSEESLCAKRTALVRARQDAADVKDNRLDCDIAKILCQQRNTNRTSSNKSTTLLKKLFRRTESTPSA